MKNILCYGDSNTFGTDPSGALPRHPRSVRWPGRLQALLGEEYYVIEEGQGGRTTAWDDPTDPTRNGLQFLPVALQSHQPLDLVILSLGTNDTKTHFSQHAHVLSWGMAQLVETIRQFPWRDGKVPQILLVAPIAIGSEIEQSEYRQSFNNASAALIGPLSALYWDLARQTGCAFVDAALYAGPGCDQLHMDAESHANLAAALADQVRLMLP